jgi:HSP20 family protein
MFGKSAVKSEEPKAIAPTASSATTDLDRPRRTPAVSLRETAEAILVDAALPGVKAEHLQVTVNQGVLTLHGTAAEPAHTGFALVHQEYEPADFHRTFTLPDNVDAGAISASTRNGVVTITLPKVKAAQPRRIAVATA